MEEAERLCDRVAILDHGKVIALGSPRELIASRLVQGLAFEELLRLTGVPLSYSGARAAA
jgi:ABC-type multidrug transport system ATPase subunit